MKKSFAYKSSNNTERIKQITQEIASLTRELEELIIEEQDTSSEEDLKINDLVIITNNYKGLRDTKGTVIRVTKKQATIRTESGCIVQRAKKNLKRLQDGSPSSHRR
jgi:hypothetical protein